MVDLDGELDLEDVADWCTRQRWFTTGPWDTEFQERRFHPKVIALYRKERARELEKAQREMEERERQERMWEEARESRERAEHQRWLMKDMRTWGRENGYFVGTRGRIPRTVVDAYREAKGL
ncbi:histone-like nucleoid-structuring protein Lsr2 [Streptomyces sp. NPDC052020]|uniref:Lsr2 family DNA-binding protein n=1 Tax=Streptomyces sp. NPDC052020 TaxID=3155677 RepID=UPI00343E8132